MIGKDEQTEESDSTVGPNKLVTNKWKSLEDNAAQVQDEIRNCFAHLTQALQLRERQLLHQADAVHTQQLFLVQSSSELLPSSIFNFDGKDNLEKYIKEFGRIVLSDTNCLTVEDTEPYKVEDYQEANKDHISFDKSIKHEDVQIRGKEIEVIQTHKSGQLEDSENVLSKCSSLFNSSLCASPAIDTSLGQKISKLDNTSMQLNESEESTFCSPLVVKQKLSPMHLALDDLQEIDTGCSVNLLNNSETSIVDSVKYDTIKIEENATNTVQNTEDHKASAYIETDFCEKHDHKPTDLNNLISTKESVANQETLRDTYEHPKQVQQWLQQILVETEIEPMIHEIGQFTQISEAHQFQLET